MLYFSTLNALPGVSAAAFPIGAAPSNDLVKSPMSTHFAGDKSWQIAHGSKGPRGAAGDTLLNRQSLRGLRGGDGGSHNSGGAKHGSDENDLLDELHD